MPAASVPTKSASNHGNAEPTVAVSAHLGAQKLISGNTFSETKRLKSASVSSCAVLDPAMHQQEQKQTSRRKTSAELMATWLEQGKESKKAYKRKHKKSTKISVTTEGTPRKSNKRRATGIENALETSTDEAFSLYGNKSSTDESTKTIKRNENGEIADQHQHQEPRARVQSENLSVTFSSESDETDAEGEKPEGNHAAKKTGLEKKKAKALGNCCLICKGRDNCEGYMNGKLIDFGKKFMESAYHYAVCYFKTRMFYSVIPAGEVAQWVEGEVPCDSSGREMLYSCDMCGDKKDSGYKTYFIHVAVVHGKLADIMARDKKNDIREVREKYLEARAREESKRKCFLCDFECSDEVMLKRHYALEHFRAHFTAARKNGKPRIPSAAKAERGLRCDICSKKEGGAETRIKGTLDDVIIHYAVLHDKLMSAMKKEAEVEKVKLALQDVYPESMQ